MTILMCAQKLTDASLIYRTEPKTKTRKMEKIKNKNGYAQKKRCRAVVNDMLFARTKQEAQLSLRGHANTMSVEIW